MNLKLCEFIGQKARPIEAALLMKGVFRIHREYFKSGEFIFYADPVSNFGLRILRDGYYEPEMTNSILSLLDEGDQFIDLGGNEGYFSVLAARKVGPTGRVLCIEPQQRLWEAIVKNLSINNCGN
jgi:hypothetical protein